MKKVEEVGQARSVAITAQTIHAAYKLDKVVIVGRAGQVVLKQMPGVLHVRIVASLEARLERIRETRKISAGEAQKMVNEHEKASAKYLKRFYNVDWSDPLYYHLVINTDKLELEAAAQLIVQAVSLLSPVQPPGQEAGELN